MCVDIDKSGRQHLAAAINDCFTIGWVQFTNISYYTTGYPDSTNEPLCTRTVDNNHILNHPTWLTFSNGCSHGQCGD